MDATAGGEALRRGRYKALSLRHLGASGTGGACDVTCSTPALRHLLRHLGLIALILRQIHPLFLILDLHPVSIALSLIPCESF
jgi:hypothetical protein